MPFRFFVVLFCCCVQHIWRVTCIARGELGSGRRCSKSSCCFELSFKSGRQLFSPVFSPLVFFFFFLCITFSLPVSLCVAGPRRCCQRINEIAQLLLLLLLPTHFFFFLGRLTRRTESTKSALATHPPMIVCRFTVPRRWIVFFLLAVLCMGTSSVTVDMPQVKNTSLEIDEMISTPQ